MICTVVFLTALDDFFLCSGFHSDTRGNATSGGCNERSLYDKRIFIRTGTSEDSDVSWIVTSKDSDAFRHFFYQKRFNSVASRRKSGGRGACG